MFGWLSEASTSASRWKRASRSSSPTTDDGSTFSATRRLSVFANLRNLGDESEDFERRGPQTPDRARFRQSDRYGSLWIIGLRGNF